MPTQLVRIDLLLFAVFVACGWVVMLIGIPTPTRPAEMQPSLRRVLLIGAPILAAICCIVAFTPLASSPSDPSAVRVWALVLLTPPIFLATIASIIAVPLAVRYKARSDQSDHASSIAQHVHVHEHHAHVHEHMHGDEAGHTHGGTIQVLPRGMFPRRTREP